MTIAITSTIAITMTITITITTAIAIAIATAIAPTITITKQSSLEWLEQQSTTEGSKGLHYLLTSKRIPPQGANKHLCSSVQAKPR